MRQSIEAALLAGSVLLAPGVASAQGVTFESLVGSKITGVVVHAREARLSNGVQGTSRVTIGWSITPLAGSRVKATYSLTTTHLVTGEPKTETWSNDVKLGEPAKHRDGSRVILFDGGKLVILRTWAEGANKAEFSFGQTDGKITCKVTNPIAREVGGGKMVTASTPWQPKLEVLSSKQLSSACSVSKA